MKNQKIIHFFDNFFTQFSKIVIIVPAVILIVGLWIKYSSNKKNFSLVGHYPTPTLVKFLPTISQNQFIEKFNLTGPLICQYQNKESSVSAFVKNKKIFFKIEEKTGIKNFLVNDDCLYLWEEKQYYGERACGVGHYLNLIESLPFFNLSDLLKESEFNNQFGRNFDFNNLLNNCQKKEVKEELFSIPKNVIFKNLSFDQIDK